MFVSEYRGRLERSQDIERIDFLPAQHEHGDMFVLAVDTTTRTGSVAIARDRIPAGEIVSDAARTHGEQLTGMIATLLGRHHLSPREIDLYAVAAGPGSFTGLRVGIAAIQGLALVTGRNVVPVSALDVLATLACEIAAPTASELVASWIDAKRGEVFSALYQVTPDGTPQAVAGPAVATPAVTLASWADSVTDRAVWFVGDGALAYRNRVVHEWGAAARFVERLPALASAIATMAVERAAAGEAVPPHAIRPIYIRRPDAEIAREGRIPR